MTDPNAHLPRRTGADSDALPGCKVVARAPGLRLWDVSEGPDWSEGDSGRFSLESVGNADPRDDGLVAEYDTLADALTAFPSLKPEAGQ